MDPSQNPLSDLDLFCDWSGDPSDTVEVRMTIEVRPCALLTAPNTDAAQVWCAPNTTVPILHTGFPIVRVKSSSIRPSEAKQTVNGKLQRPGCESFSEPPHTPERKSIRLREPSSLLYSNDLSSLPDTGSVIVRSSTGGDGSTSKIAFGDSSRSAILDQTPITSPTSRKRNAKAASLPDSVTDSERGYGGTKHKLKYTVNDLPSPVVMLKHSSKPSLIPRPVSSLNQQTEPAKIPLPTDSAPVSVADFDRFEDLPLIHKENLLKTSVDETVDAAQPLLADADDVFGDLASLALTVQAKREQDLEKLSIIASPGTASDNESGANAPVSSVGSPAEEVIIMSSSPPVPVPAHPGHPRLVTFDKHYHVHTPSSAIPGQYSVSFIFLLCLHKGQPKGWWNVTFPDLPRLQNDESGYVYFWIPPDQGIEIRTTHLKRYSINQACMMGQFPLPLRFTLPLRLCDGRFYGFLRDFKVTHTIRAEVLEDDDLRTCRVKYVAVCSIDLIGRDFWSEKCGFSLFVHGGPDGDFTCNLLAPRGQFQTVHLESGRDSEPGISSVQVICPPLSLASLAFSWEMVLPRERLTTWMPRIKSSPEVDDLEDGLQTDYATAETQKNLEITTVEPLARLEGDSSRTRRSQFKRAWFSRRWRRAFSVILLALFFRLLYRIHEAWCHDGHALVRVVEVEIAPFPVEDVPLIAEFPQIEDDAVEDVFIPDDLSIESGSVAEDVLQTADAPKIEPAMPSPMASPSLSLRDRIDYLLGWQGPLGDL